MGRNVMVLSLQRNAAKNRIMAKKIEDMLPFSL